MELNHQIMVKVSRVKVRARVSAGVWFRLIVSVWQCKPSLIQVILQYQSDFDSTNKTSPAVQ